MAEHHRGTKLALFASAMTIGWTILVGEVSLSFGEYLRLALGAAATVILGSLCDLAIARGLMRETAGAFLYGFTGLAGAVAVPTMIAPNDVAGDRF